MKQKILRILLWSWLITIPVTMVGGYLLYKTLDRFYTFSIRYDPSPNNEELSFSRIAHYEYHSLFLAFRTAIYRYFNRQQKLRSIHIFASKSDLATLNAHLPQSGYHYIKAALAVDDKLIKAKIRYRGDFSKHWAWYKKSIRVKTSKDHLYHGMRKFNLLSPAFTEQLNDYLAYQLATQLGLLAPRTDLLHVYLNGEYLGIHVLVEQLSEISLRQNKQMPSDIYRGEMYGKDAFKDSKIHTLFETAAVWDKVAINNHYEAGSKKPLDFLIDLLQDQNSEISQLKLSQLLDMEAWAKFSFYEALIQSWHYDAYHNWRLVYDPWKQKFTPIVWDPVGWAKGWFPEKEPEIVSKIITTKLHKALFNNGDFLRAREKIAGEFFNSTKEDDFINFVAMAVAKMQTAVKKDPALNEPDENKVISAVLQLKQTIGQVFTELKKINRADEYSTLYQFQENQLELFVRGHRVVRKVRLEFDTSFAQNSQIKFVVKGEIIKDFMTALTVNQHQLIINTTFLPNNNPLLSNDYQLIFANLSSDHQLLNVMIDYGEGWENAELAKNSQIRQLQANKKTIPLEILRSSSWQIFYDTGHGFNEQESRKVAGRIDGNNLWHHKITVAQNVRAIRVDFPDMLIRMQVSDIKLSIEEKNYSINSSQLHLNGLKRSGQWLESYGHADPYFSFDVPLSANSAVSNKQSMVLTFKLTLIADKFYKPTYTQLTPLPLIWSGEVLINEVKTIERPLYIKPGTRILLAENASLIIKNRLHAVGTEKKPIHFFSQQTGQLPWGTIALVGQKANASIIRHCEFAQGSGLKQDLFEYTGMLSIHHVNKVSISDCLFRDNAVVDDMVHVVYSDVEFKRTVFRQAVSDALDIDISTATITDSLFENSGNDAIDLMTSQASVAGSVFRANGDKGISVGENSQLFAVNNLITHNSIAVQVKDASSALLYNQTLADNKIAVAANKKNWRYGKGGLTAVAKSFFKDNGINLQIKKGSKAYLFDNAIEGSWVQKRIKGWLQDAEQDKTKSTAWLNEEILALPEVSSLINNTSDRLLKQHDNAVRGAALK